MASGQPGPRGDLSPVTDPAHFPSSFESLIKKTQPELVIYNGSNSTGGDVFTEPFSISMCEGFAVYVVQGTGGWNIEFTPNPNNNESAWVKGIASDKSGTGYYESVSYHPWVRGVIRTGATNVIMWLYRKYATY